MGLMESNGGVHTGGGDSNGKANGIVGKWVVDPVFDGNGKKEEIYVYNIMPLLLLPPQCEHPHWIPLDPFMKGKILRCR